MKIQFLICALLVSTSIAHATGSSEDPSQEITTIACFLQTQCSGQVDENGTATALAEQFLTGVTSTEQFKMKSAELKGRIQAIPDANIDKNRMQALVVAINSEIKAYNDQIKSTRRHYVYGGAAVGFAAGAIISGLLIRQNPPESGNDGLARPAVELIVTPVVVTGLTGIGAGAGAIAGHAMTADEISNVENSLSH